MADGEVLAENLSEETASTLEGTEYYVMFDGVEGKKTLLSVIADFVAQHGKIDNTDIPTIVDSVKSMISSEYDSTKTYELGELVWYENDLYKCTTAITTAEAWTAAHWTQTDLADEVLTIKDELADVKEDFNELGLSVVNGELCVTYVE